MRKIGGSLVETGVPVFVAILTPGGRAQDFVSDVDKFPFEVNLELPPLRVPPG